MLLESISQTEKQKEPNLFVSLETLISSPSNLGRLFHVLRKYRSVLATFEDNTPSIAFLIFSLFLISLCDHIFVRSISHSRNAKKDNNKTWNKMVG
jgi:hypothetical protein